VQLHWFYAAIRLAGYPVDLIADEEVRAGGLGRYDALVLADFDYASASLWRAIRQYAATDGKVVFVDKSTALRPEGAVELPISYGQRAPDRPDQRNDVPPLQHMSSMVRLLRPSLAARLAPARYGVDGSDYVAPFFLYSGDGRLLTLVNYHLTQSQEVRYRLPAGQRTFVYDADTGALVAQIGAAGAMPTLSALIPGAGAARYLMLPTPIAALSITSRIHDQHFVVRVAVVDRSGRAIRFPFPIKLELFDPDGRVVPAYETRAAVHAGKGYLDVRIPKSRRMDPDGSWTVRATEFVTGLSASAVADVDKRRRAP
jgi:hypothetical protein